jgi:hypothetical protein
MSINKGSMGKSEKKSIFITGDLDPTNSIQRKKTMQIIILPNIKKT